MTSEGTVNGIVKNAVINLYFEIINNNSMINEVVFNLESVG